MELRINEAALAKMVALEADSSVARICEEIAEDARRYAPKDTGALAAGIDSATDGAGNGRVVVNRVGDDPKVPLYVEYGTENQPAQPYMRPALYKTRD